MGSNLTKCIFFPPRRICLDIIFNISQRLLIPDNMIIKNAFALKNLRELSVFQTYTALYTIG